MFDAKMCLSKGIITITLILTANFISKKIAQVSIW